MICRSWKEDWLLGKRRYDFVELNKIIADSKGEINMSVIRSIRGGSAGLNEEDRLEIARLLIKAGYAVKIRYQLVPGNAKAKKEYVIEYWEDKE